MAQSICQRSWPCSPAEAVQLCLGYQDQQLWQKVNFPECTHGRNIPWSTPAGTLIYVVIYTSWLDCPRKFYFNYVDKIFPSVSLENDFDSLISGTISHKIIEVFHKTHATEEELPALTKKIMQEFIQEESLTLSPEKFLKHELVFNRRSLNGIRFLKLWLPRGIASEPGSFSMNLCGRGWATSYLLPEHDVQPLARTAGSASLFDRKTLANRQASTPGPDRVVR